MTLLPRTLQIAALVTAFAAHSAPSDLFQRVGFDQNLGGHLPLKVSRDSADRTVTLGRFFDERPVVLVLGYYQCPNLCGIVWQGLLEAVRRLDFNAGADFDIVAVSIDPAETPQLAYAKQQAYLQQYDRPGASGGWHFLTGDEQAIRKIADAADFFWLLLMFTLTLSDYLTR